MTTIEFGYLTTFKLRRTRFTSTTFLFIMLLLILARPVATQAASGSIWSVVPSPDPSKTSLSNDILESVSALSDTNVWTVGSFNSTNGNNIDHTLAEHWNGTAWSVVPTPNVGTQGSKLQAVSALSDTDAWAVGESDSSGSANNDLTLIEHWNGTAWSVVPSPNLSHEGDFLTGVVALAANNAWAVGWFEDNVQSDILPLILHWNGTAWADVTNGVPTAGAFFLHGITAISATDIWAVGESGNGPTNFEMHWNGTQWSVANQAIFPSGGQETLASVAAASSNDVWAVGSYAPSVFAELQTLAVHWDGKKWSKVTTLNVDKFFNRLFGVAVVKSTDVWAVGDAFTTNGLNRHTLIEHWNGTQWSIVPSPNMPPTGNIFDQLNSVSVSGPTTLWAAGSFDSLVKGNPGLRTLTEHTSQG